MFCNIEIRFYDATAGEPVKVFASGNLFQDCRDRSEQQLQETLIEQADLLLRECCTQAQKKVPLPVELMENPFFNTVPFCDACGQELSNGDMVGIGDGEIKPRHETFVGTEPDGGAWCVHCFNGRWPRQENSDE